MSRIISARLRVRLETAGIISALIGVAALVGYVAFGAFGLVFSSTTTAGVSPDVFSRGSNRRRGCGATHRPKSGWNGSVFGSSRPRDRWSHRFASNRRRNLERRWRFGEVAVRATISYMSLAELKGIPDVARPLWTKLVAEDLLPVHELFASVRSYRESLARRAQVADTAVDLKLVDALTDTSLELLGSLQDDTPEQTRRLVQAAVRYFVIEDDADRDLDSILGLDDDAEVLNAVVAHLGHEAWLVEIV